jgi:hypothetical protein
MRKLKEAKAKRTLERYSKEELIDHCLCLQYNNEVLREGLNAQYNNAIKLFEMKDLYEKNYKDIIRGMQILEGINGNYEAI